MISFASLFLGLVFGLVNVELVAAPEVDRVELLLDGTRIVELRAPWRTALDLGCEPAPHEIVAIAYDESGKVLGQARQVINTPRPRAEASLILEPGRDGKGTIARLVWRCLTGETPSGIEVTFDGTRIPVTDVARIELPAYAPQTVHFLRATLSFPGGAVAVADAIFGGSRSLESARAMTAVPVVLAADASLPPPGEMAGWFEARGAPLEVLAFDNDRQEVVLICEASARDALRRVNGRRDDRVEGRGKDLGFRYLWPISESKRQSTMLVNSNPISQTFTRDNGGISLALLTRLNWPAAPPKGQQIADAVAVAALTAAEEQRRRAVVLLLGPEAFDASRLSPSEAEGFLEHLRVPLAVWSIGKTQSPEAARWRGVTTVSTRREIDAALASLYDRLNRQRIVWVGGSYLPQEVVISPAARGLQLAR